ncbi:GH32 C-terminal domain-containing protein [Nonomuraea rubra]|uniref:GH32 C-terminal domain-containing protein n=1 Tax=Nonomuraea rubra TaxID=46180 RepID=UPI001C878280
MSSNKNDKSFCVDRTSSGAVSSLFAGLGVQCGAVTLTNDVLTLDVFLGTSMVEADAGGHKSITPRVYPARDESLGLPLFADGAATVRSLKVWAMKPAFGG